MSEEHITINRTTAGIRDFIFDEMERLANGQVEVDRLKAMSKAGDVILKSAALDIAVNREIAKSRGREGSIELTQATMRLKLGDK